MSPQITVQASTSSVILEESTFTYNLRIPYISAANQTLGSGSTTLAAYRVVDGNPSDGDLANTIISSITFNITSQVNSTGPFGPGSTAIKQIGLFTSGGTLISSQPYSGAPSVTFSGLSITANDDSFTTFLVKAAYNNTAAAIGDRDVIRLVITDINQTSESSKFGATGSIVGANYNSTTETLTTASTPTPVDRNIINVVATRLDFITNPPTNSGIDQPFGSSINPTVPIVQARDANQVLDLEHGFSATLSTAGAGISPSSVNFANGVLSLSGISYTSPGLGKIRVQSNGIDSNTSPQASGDVDVFHVTANDTRLGLVAGTSLAGGSVDRVIFGSTFSAAYQNAGNPTLKSFTVTFNIDISEILTNPRIYESSNNNVYEEGTDNIVLPAQVTTTVGATSFTFTFNTAKSLSSSLTYFLMVDIDTRASGTTPDVIPSLVDNGYTSPTTTNNITTDGGIGSSTANFSGRTYNFASIFPPLLVRSFPASGQLDVDPTQGSIDLVFTVPVWTMDRKVELYDLATNALVSTLLAQNGFPVPNPLTPANLAGSNNNPLKFIILPGTLAPDKVYYVKIAPGRINADPALSTGIRDQAGNLFGGISFSSILYFKTARIAPPKILSPAGGQATSPAPVVTSVSGTGGTISATFDITGKAFYLVLPDGSPQPTIAQIRGASYPGRIAQGEFPINQTGTISQSGSFNATLAPSTSYDVWLAAESYRSKDGVFVPTPSSTITPIPTLAHYGNSANAHIEGAAGPTIEFTTPNSFPSTITVNNPDIRICKNSFQIVNQPIVINEGSAGNFSGGSQLFYLVLPAGFQFDATVESGSPKFGRITLTGSDFTPGSGRLNFLGNSILQVEYINNGSASIDNIRIEGLRVFVSSNASAPMVRLGGTGGITSITNFATFTSFDASKIGFDNAYARSIGRAPVQDPPTAAVTVIPDNFNLANGARVELFPLPPAGDFGPSSFSGPGVNVNELSLSAVTLGVPFNITITHTDNNGCVSQNAVQYTVYDRNTAIGGLAPQYCFKNPNFPNPSGSVRYDIAYTNLPAYYMESLTASIPPNTPASLPFGGPDGAAWKTIIENTLLVRGTAYPIDNPRIGGIYYDYSFDENKILNASGVPNPYSYFRQETPRGNTFYSGGLLGAIEFNGNYQSVANAVVQIPLRQLVNIYIPAIPIVEVNPENRITVRTDPTDATKTMPVFCENGDDITFNGFPAASGGTSTGFFILENATDGLVIYAANQEFQTQPGGTNAGGFTRIEFIKPLNLSVGASVNVFGTNITDPSGQPEPAVVTSKINNTTYVIDLPFNGSNIVTSVRLSIPLAGMTDGGNGTGSIDPLVLKNGYRPIRIIYTYKDNVTPNATSCSSNGGQVIQITPNPRARFSPQSLPSVNVLNSTSYCEDRAIQFDANASSVLPPAVIRRYEWDFGDDAGSSGLNPNRINARRDSTLLIPGFPPVAIGTGQVPRHTYNQASSYDIRLRVFSDFGCPSADTVRSIPVGNILDAQFNFTGISTADPIAFVNTTTIPPGEIIQTHLWNYRADIVGGPTGGGASPSFTYPSPGQFKVRLTVTTNRGCVDTVSRPIVILPHYIASASNSYVTEGTFEANNGNWQVYRTAANLVATQPSWECGVPDGPVIGTPPLGAKAWVTKLSGGYSANERSALYSPAFNTQQLERPMVSFNSFVDMPINDGIVLQYSTDNKNVVDPTKVWKVLGKLNEGLDWYNKSNIGSKPGDQPVGDIGWSDLTTAAWQDSKFALVAEGTGPPLILKEDRLVLRFAIAANDQIQGRGFGLDNFRLGERTRTILLESFTNVANDTKIGNTFVEQMVNDSIRNFNATNVGLEVVKFNYHVGFPGIDPFNQDNPGDPSSRALYYNIETTPRSRLDGQAEPNPNQPLFTQWGRGEFNKRSLQLAQANLVIRSANPNPNDFTTGGKVAFFIDVIPTSNLPANTILYTGILEESVPKASLLERQNLIKSNESVFEFVVKKMLPSVVGIKTGALVAGPPSAPISYPFGPFEWIPDMPFYSPSTQDLAIGVFLQNEITKEIYQSEIQLNLNDPVVTVTSLEDLLPEDVLAYPNPANEQLTVELPARFDQPIRLRMVDQLGRTLDAGNIPTGETKQTIDTSNLAAGMYLLQLEGIQGTPVRKKVIIVH
ncbi:MAG: T9SS type A sorting domain-containing protein [Cyclobacteriaceae bacterium]